MPIGTNVEGKMVAALRRLGFDEVFDTDFGADLTIMEEANEFIERVQKRRHAAADHLLLPRLGQILRALLSRICTDNLSTCKSPQQMFGAHRSRPSTPRKTALIPKTSFVVSVMPCTAKKFEVGRRGRGRYRRIRMWTSP